MISKMSCVEVAGPIEQFDSAVDNIQELGLLHIEEIPLAEYGEREQLHKIHLSEEKEQEHRSCQELAEMLDEAVDYIPPAVRRELRNGDETTQHYLHWEKQPISSLSSAARVQHAKVRSFKRRERNLSDDLRVLGSYEEVVNALAPMVEGNVLPQEYEFLGVIFEQRNRNARGLFVEEIEKLTAGQYRFLESPLSKGRTAALVGYHRDFREEVRPFVSEAGITEMNFPRHLRNRPFEEAFAMLEQELDQLREKRAKLRSQAERFYRERGAELIAMHNVVQDTLSRFDAISKFARTRYTFIIKGWIERKELARFRSELAQRLGESVIVWELKKPDIGKPPVRLENPRPVDNFEPLLGLLPLPQYGSVDPTSFMAFFFPPIFGLMLGDIGYGLVILIGSLLLRFTVGKRSRLAKRISFVASMSAAFTIVFGFVFGELFGTLGHELGLHPLWRERFPASGEGVREAIIGYLFIAGAVGLVHVTLGHILGMVGARRRGDIDVFVTNLARLFGIYLLVFLIGAFLGVLPQLFLYVGFAAVAGFIGLMVYAVRREPTHGLLLPLEVLSSMGNIFSYARIMAIGMASVVLAFLANMFGGLIGNVVFAVIVVVMVHGLNLVLGVADPTIQGLRLHYVEFFSKFYMAGGRPFSPFRKLRNQLAVAG